MPFKATTQDTFGLRCIHVIAPIVGKQSVFILLQNENGPCPLIALANVLALRGIVDWSVVPKRAGSEPGSHIDVCDVLNHIGTMVNELSSKHTCSEAEKTFVLDEALRALPGLVQGMDLNIRFRNHKDYEVMASLTVFDILNISLVHGWVIDKNDTELQSLIGSRSYNQLMDDLLRDSVESEHDHSTANTNTSVAGKVRNFLTNGQLTFTGMFELIENVSDGDNVVFFRSNHFSVLTKHGEYLYTLVTDVGYADHPDIVWERIVDLDGDTVLCDAEFTSAKEKYRNQVAHICENQDAALAYQLQMQEQKKAEETRRSNITREAPTQRLHQGNISRPRLDMNRKSDNCAIL